MADLRRANDLQDRPIYEQKIKEASVDGYLYVLKSLDHNSIGFARSVYLHLCSLNDPKRGIAAVAWSGTNLGWDAFEYQKILIQKYQTPELVRYALDVLKDVHSDALSVFTYFDKPDCLVALREGIYLPNMDVAPRVIDGLLAQNDVPTWEALLNMQQTKQKNTIDIAILTHTNSLSPKVVSLLKERAQQSNRSGDYAAYCLYAADLLNVPKQHQTFILKLSHDQPARERLQLIQQLITRPYNLE